MDILIKQGLVYVGTTDVTMARGEGNSFINIGTLLERAIQSTDILDVKFTGVNTEMEKAAEAT